MSVTCAQWDENVDDTVDHICIISNGHPTPQNKVILVLKSFIYIKQWFMPLKKKSPTKSLRKPNSLKRQDKSEK